MLNLLNSNGFLVKTSSKLLKLTTTSLITLGVFTLWKTGNHFWQGFTSLFHHQVTTPQVEDIKLILSQINNVSELTTSVFVTDAIAPISSQRKIGDWVIGKTNLLYIARGEVRAGLDLSKITPQDIIIKDKEITIQLPPPEILDSKIDVTQSKVYHYDRGFLNLGPDNAPELQTQAQKETLEKIKESACQREILQQANEKGILVVSELMKNAGYEEVKVKVNASSQCKGF